MTWEAVEQALPNARALVWDGCHKIYLALDDAEVQTFRDYEYGMDDDSKIILTDDLEDEAEAMKILQTWFDESCPLRFISGVHSVPEGTDKNAGFTRLIEQFEFDENDEEGDD